MKDPVIGQEPAEKSAYASALRRRSLWITCPRQSAADSAPGPLDPTPQWFIGNERFSHAKLAAFDPTPHALYERLTAK